ncbi:MAG: replication-associated recombination protein A [Paracoccaceae bacterium]
MPDLFASDQPDAGAGRDRPRPLADRLRPARLDQVIGQRALLAPGTPLRAMLDAGRLSSCILWGPPGVGKTTVARLLADEANLPFTALSAIFAGVSDLRRAFDAAALRDRPTLLFVDEIHRFDKRQQDAFLPRMEDGTVVLIGATTENPSFALNAALLSRAQVLVLTALGPDDLSALLARVEEHTGPLPLTPDAREALIGMADGDGRALIGLAEQVAGRGPPLDREALRRRVTRRAPRHDRTGDRHYDLISALHKAVRASDVDAALYWLARMIDGGEDPRFVARRLTRMAVEDVGLADPAAQGVCIDAWNAWERMGSPEGDLALAQAAIYLAMAPKSNAGYAAWKGAVKLAARTSALEPPDHAVNAPTDLMKSLGRAEGYAYDHDHPGGVSGQSHLPEGIARPNLYAPTDRGFEREMRRRADWLSRRRDAWLKRPAGGDTGAE